MMNQDSHEPADGLEQQAPEANAAQAEGVEAEGVEAEGVEAEGVEAVEVKSEGPEAWSDEFTPEELAELFGGEEKVPAPIQVLAPELIEAEDEVEDGEAEAGERLQKLLARSGVASRRAAEELIRAGRVSVNNEVVSELGRRARPGKDRIAVDGKSLKILSPGTTVVLLHKPRGCVSTKDDPQNRTTVMAFLPKKLAHLHPVGRLDFDTSGLLLLSDDGDLTNLLLHPSHGVEKRYHARVRGVVDAVTIDRLQKGVRLDDGVTEPCRVRVKAQTLSNALLEIVLREGRNRQIRRMLQAVGHPVSALRRVRLGPLDLGGLPAGAFRELLPGEVHLLKKAARAPRPPLKAARPFAYKPRPSKAEDKTLPQASTRPSTRPAPGAPDAAPPRARPASERPATRSAPRDSALRGSASRDSASRDGASRDGALRDSAPRDGAPRDRITRDRAPRDDARSDAARSEFPRYGAREGAPRDRPSQASRPSQDRAPRDGAPRYGGPWDAAARDNTSRDRAPRDGARAERPMNQRPAAGAPGERAGSYERSREAGGRTSRPNSNPRPRPGVRPEAREERGARSEGASYRPGERAGSSGAPRDSRPPTNRPPAPRPNTGRAEPSGAQDAGAGRTSARPTKPGPPRPAAPRAQGAARAESPQKRGGSKLAKKIEDRWK